MKKPLVSVIITCFNLENLISKCINSVINQTYNNLEIIVVDDCSSDNSVNIIEQYSKKDSRIKLIKLESNSGIGIAKKVGGEQCCGKFLTFVDGDDYILPEYIEHNVQHILEKKCELVISDKKLKFGDCETDFNCSTQFHPSAVWFINTMFLTKSLFNKISFSELRLYEDYGTLPRLWYYSKDSYFYSHDREYVWVKHNFNTTKTSSWRKRTIYSILAAIENYVYFKNIENMPKIHRNFKMIEFTYSCILKHLDEWKEFEPELEIIRNFINDFENESRMS